MAMKISSLVQDRYSEGAKELQPEICSSVKYNTEYLKIISATIIEPNLALKRTRLCFLLFCLMVKYAHETKKGIKPVTTNPIQGVSCY
tara:strand:- start:1896 stop:2159 length:264 start_codon:yes stop_codon:yes gene_type:complete